MLTDYIVRDSDGNVVGKYRTMSEPEVPDGFVEEQVDDVGEYQIKQNVAWFPSA